MVIVVVVVVVGALARMIDSRGRVLGQRQLPWFANHGENSEPPLSEKANARESGTSCVLCPHVPRFHRLIGLLDSVAE